MRVVSKIVISYITLCLLSVAGNPETIATSMLNQQLLQSADFNPLLFKGTCFMFFGDSILRQLYHSIIHGIVRKMPIVIDPVYGFASYRLSMPDQTNENQWHDSFRAVHKQSTIGQHVVADPPKGWTIKSGLEMIFSFQQGCVNDVAALQQLKASNLLKVHRRLIFVFNVGATTVLAKPGSVECLSETLPLSLAAAALQMPRMNRQRHHVVIMNQPVAQTRLKALTPDSFRSINEAVHTMISKVNSSVLTPLLLDFKGLVDGMNAVPVLEDGLHFECMWGSVGRGRMSHPWGSSNQIGYTPAYIRGLHFKQPRSCGLVCDDVLLKQLGRELLASLSVGVEYSKAHPTQYIVDRCVSAYDHIPCPLYPGFSNSSGQWNSNWESNSTHVDYMSSLQARHATYHDLLASRFSGLTAAEVSSAFTIALKQLKQGEFKQCASAPEYVRFVDTDWCEAAVGGPGGSKAPSASPLVGVWCSLPESGSFRPV